MTWVLWIPAVLAALGVGLLTWTALSSLADLARAGLGRRRRAVRRLLQSREQDDAGALSEAELYGLPRSLLPWMAASALAGLIVSWALVDGPAQVLGVAAGVVPLVWKRRRIALRQQEIRRQVAELIQEVRLRLAFGGSLGAVLNTVAVEPGREGVVVERLRHHRRLILIEGPEAVLAHLAEDLRSPELRMLLRRVRAARQGGASFADALRAAAEEVAVEMVRRADVEVEGAPLRLLFPMLIGLLPPILALALYPPAYGLIASLAGAGPSMMP